MAAGVSDRCVVFTFVCYAGGVRLARLVAARRLRFESLFDDDRSPAAASSPLSLHHPPAHTRTPTQHSPVNRTRLAALVATAARATCSAALRLCRLPSASLSRHPRRFCWLLPLRASPAARMTLAIAYPSTIPIASHPRMLLTHRAPLTDRMQVLHQSGCSMSAASSSHSHAAPNQTRMLHSPHPFAGAHWPPLYSPAMPHMLHMQPASSPAGALSPGSYSPSPMQSSESPAAAAAPSVSPCAYAPPPAAALTPMPLGSVILPPGRAMQRAAEHEVEVKTT